VCAANGSNAKPCGAATSQSSTRSELIVPCVNAPNPFSDSTQIPFSLIVAGEVRLAIYDPAGRLVRVLQDGPLAPGRYTRVWDGRDGAGNPVRRGLYFVVAASGGQRAVRKALRIE